MKTQLAKKIDTLITAYGVPPNKVLPCRSEILDIFLDLYNCLNKELQKKKNVSSLDLAKVFERVLNR